MRGRQRLCVYQRLQGIRQAHVPYLSSLCADYHPRNKMVAPAQLDVDVLSVVCEFLSDVSDVVSMTLICSSIHPIAMGWLLRMRPVFVRSGPSIRRFHSFLFHDTPARAPHVRVVQIDLRWPGMPQDQVDDLSLLLDILNVCKHIEHITVAFEQLSQHMVEDPRIVQAIAAISSLRSLSVWSASVTTLALLHQISAPLRTVIIYCHSQSLRFWYPAALEPFLPRVARTLEKFEVGRFGVDTVVILAGSHVSSPPTVSLSKYPAVRSLSVQSFRGKPLLEDLQHLFPVIEGTLSLGSLDVQCKEATYDHIRATNQRAQERDGSGRSLSRAWKRLDRIICDAQMLYVLGLRCPIRLAMIDFGPVYKHGRYVADALRENPVPRLKLTLEHNFDDFGGLCSPELAETLTHLTLCLLYTTDYGITPRDRHAGAAPQLKWDDVLASNESRDPHDCMR